MHVQVVKDGAQRRFARDQKKQDREGMEAQQRRDLKRGH